MSTPIFTTDKPCKATCPPCNHDCNQSDTCPLRVQTFQPDFEIEHTKVSYRPTPLAYFLFIFSVVMFVIAAVRNA